MDNGLEKLDNPVWFSLLEKHQQFAINFNGVKFYDPAYCPFGGFIDSKNLCGAVEAYADLCNNFFVVGPRPEFGKGIQLKRELVCCQMMIADSVEIAINEQVIKLGSPHRQELFNLVNLVQPGYFREKTADLGNYFGIFKNKQLVAVTGERMKMDSFTEVSAVVTHPDHTGKGYAKQLVAYTVNKILKEDITPFLHVAETNINAIKLYEKIGFHHRRKISFWNLIKPE